MSVSTQLRWLLTLTVLVVLSLVIWFIGGPNPTPAPPAPTRSLAERLGTVFTTQPSGTDLVPRVTRIAIPTAAGADAIWGALGRDSRGHIWFAVSAKQEDEASAQLYELAPETRTASPRGSVVEQLKQAGIYRVGESQNKIHTKLIEADDGYLYFASTDEMGENEATETLPNWGSHLWRVHPTLGRWEHLASLREGVVAAAGLGNKIYLLGYWGHVLYSYDTASMELQRVRIGSVAGHVSRNLFVDGNGHVYVPRVAGTDSQPNPFTLLTDDGYLNAYLVELSDDLTQLAEHPLQYYLDGPNVNGNHGIIGFTHLKDGSVIFTTHLGYLYKVTPHENGAAQLAPLGWFHPAGKFYIPSLFTFAGERYVAGPARKGKHRWIVYDLAENKPSAHDLDFPQVFDALLLYGSTTRDRFGNFYVGGRHRDGTGALQPLLLQLGIDQPQ